MYHRTNYEMTEERLKREAKEAREAEIKKLEAEIAERNDRLLSLKEENLEQQ